jgi:hypothetical protein
MMMTSRQTPLNPLFVFSEITLKAQSFLVPHELFH